MPDVTAEHMQLAGSSARHYLEDPLTVPQHFQLVCALLRHPAGSTHARLPRKLRKTQHVTVQVGLQLDFSPPVYAAHGVVLCAASVEQHIRSAQENVDVPVWESAALHIKQHRHTLLDFSCKTAWLRVAIHMINRELQLHNCAVCYQSMQFAGR